MDVFGVTRSPEIVTPRARRRHPASRAYRSSDHDPVLVGLRFELPTPRIAADCRKGGWRSLYRVDGSAFRNQGLCIRHVNTGR